MGSVEWITPSTLAIPVMRHSTRIKHVAHLVWLWKKVSLLTVKIRQPSHEFTFGVDMSFIPCPLVLTPVV
jgi:hypothetical protein